MTNFLSVFTTSLFKKIKSKIDFYFQIGLFSFEEIIWRVGPDRVGWTFEVHTIQIKTADYQTLNKYMWFSIFIISCHLLKVRFFITWHFTCRKLFLLLRQLGMDDYTNWNCKSLFVWKKTSLISAQNEASLY